MTDDFPIPDDQADLIEEVLDALAQGYGINPPNEDDQEMYLDAWDAFTSARRGDEVRTVASNSTDPDDFDFTTDDILP